MRVFTLTIVALVALSEAVQDKRGAQGQAPGAALAYSKLQQPVQRAVAAQPQFYSQGTDNAYALPQQFQYQPQTQAVAYAQPTFAKYAAAPAPLPVAPAVAKAVPAPLYRQQFSSANDVSSFAYSSPVVSYNSLGYLHQVIGKAAPGAIAKAVPAAPAPVAYQAQPAPVAYSQPEYLTQAQAQQYVAAPQAQAQAQTYQAQSYTAQTAPQSIYAQAPQSIYSQAPQYFSSQAKQASGAYAQ